MSFYGTSQPQTSDPTVPTAAPNGWPVPTALDQLILQQTQPSQMGALRRPGSSPTETLVTELPNYASPLGNERLSLEASLDPKRNQDLQRNAIRQPVRNQTHPSPQSQANNYWERTGLGIHGCNIPNLPPAYQTPGDLKREAATVEDFTSASKHPQPLRNHGRYVLHLMKFHEKQKRPGEDGTLENFWKPLFEEFFAPTATMHIVIKAEDSAKMQSIELPVEALPRIWMSKFNAGVQEERLLMETPREYLYNDGNVVVDCRRTVIVTKYEQSTVITDGHLRVHLQNDKKIVKWHFSSGKHQELVPMSLVRHGVPPPSAICKHGMPLAVLRLMSIAEDIKKMSTKIDSEISRLLRKTTKQREQEPKTTTGFAGISKGESKGTAYHAILSQFGVQGVSRDQAFGDAPVGNEVTPGGVPAAPTVQGLPETVVQGLHNNIALDYQRSMANGNRNNSNMGDAMASWRLDQQADVFSNIFDDSVSPSFAQHESVLVDRGAMQKRGEMGAKKHMAANLTVGQGPQAGQSVVDVVTATATGHTDWGVGPTPERNFSSTEQQGDELDPNLQLLNTVPCDLNLQSGREAPGSNAHGQSAPPGLSIFTPQVEELAKNGKTQSGRGKADSAIIRDVRSSSNHATATGNHKNYGNVRSFQRMSSNRVKRSSQITSPMNARPPSTTPSMVGASQSVVAQNGSAPSKRNSPGRTIKNGSDHGAAATGSRRNSQRNSGSDGREKRQKTSKLVNQT